MGTLADLFTSLGTVYQYVIGIFGTALDTITSNAILALPVYAGIAVGVIFLVIKVIRKFGVRGRIR